MGGIHAELFSLAESDSGIENKQLSKRMKCRCELVGRIPECFRRRGSPKSQARLYSGNQIREFSASNTRLRMHTFA